MLDRQDQRQPLGLTHRRDDVESAQFGVERDGDEHEHAFVQLRLECRELVKAIEKEENLAGLFQDERQRVNYFWIVAKKELEDK